MTAGPISDLVRSTRAGGLRWFALLLLALLGAAMLLSLPMAWEALRAIPVQLGVNYGIYLLLERKPHEALDHLHQQAARYPGNPLAGEALLAVALHLDTEQNPARLPLLEAPENLGDSPLLALLRQVRLYQHDAITPDHSSGAKSSGPISNHPLLNIEQARWLELALLARAREDWPSLNALGSYPAGARPSAGDRAGQLLRLRASFELGDWREARLLLPGVLLESRRFHPDAMGPAAALLLLGQRDDELQWHLHRLRAWPVDHGQLSSLHQAVDHAVDYLADSSPLTRDTMKLRMMISSGREALARRQVAELPNVWWREALRRRLNMPGDAEAATDPGASGDGWTSLPLAFRFDVLMQQGMTIPEALKAMGLAERIIPLESMTLLPGQAGQFVGEGVRRHLRVSSAGRLTADLSGHPAHHWGAMYAVLLVGGEDAEGEWPAVMVSVNQRRMGLAYAHRRIPLMIPVYLEAPAGGFSELTLHYFNNAVSAEGLARGEDRNLLVHALMLLPAIR